MTTWVSMVRTGRGPDSNRIEIPAGNDREAWIAQTALRPALAQVTSGDEWIISRWSAALAWLNRWPESESGLTPYAPSDAPGDHGSEEAINVATIAVGHWGLETGWGANEWNWNLGGIHCPANEADCFREAPPRDGSEPETFRSFDSFAAFADAYFTMVSRTPDYSRAWEAMRDGSANAILRLWAADYTCGGKTASEATQLCERVRRVVERGMTDEIDRLLPSPSQIRATEANVPNRCTPTSRNRGGGGGGGGGAGGSSSGRTLMWAAVAALGIMALGKGR